MSTPQPIQQQPPPQQPQPRQTNLAPPPLPKRNSSHIDTSAGDLKDAKRFRATVPPLPELLDIPESKMYEDLVAMEQKLDWTITRRRVEVTEAAGRPIRLKRTLRLFISNTSSFQNRDPNEPGPSGTSSEADASDRSPPSWQLKIEGRLLDSGNVRVDKKGNRKFSTLLKSMVVEVDNKESSGTSNIVEWKKNPSETPRDGFTIQRPGSTPTPTRIILEIDHSPPRFRLAPELATLLQTKEDTRIGILSALWSYIKINNLQDKEDRRRVVLDAKLKKLLGHPIIPLAHLPELVNRHLSPPEPIVINYLIRTDVPSHAHPKCFDIEFEMDDPVKIRVNQALSAFDQEGGKEIVGLDEEISNLSLALRNARTKRDFLSSFASDPSNFIHSWLDNQARDLSVALHPYNSQSSGRGIGGTGLHAEDLRRSEVFRLPWAEEAAVVYEGQRAMESVGRLLAPSQQQSGIGR